MHTLINTRKVLLLLLLIGGLLSALVLYFAATRDKQVPATETAEITVSPEITETVAPTTTTPVIPTVSVTATVTPVNTIEQLNCTDCTLAPVDKWHQLRADYVPDLTATGLNGGGKVTTKTATALRSMFSEMQASGIDPLIISAYRSYYEQRSTYNYWVEKQLTAAPGISRAEAEKRADRISARAGHSEHQLGTTVDLKCNGCTSFDNSASNTKLYNFLRERAHEFGFIISYPPETESLTGYKSEPWHIRYLGVELASELWGRSYLEGNGEYGAKFLLEKALY